jgi:hypothetical protein
MVGITAFNELKTQYIEAVFKIKKVKPAFKNTGYLLRLLSEISCKAIINGTKANSNIKEVYGIGGQANQSRKLESNASQVVLFIIYNIFRLFLERVYRFLPKQLQTHLLKCFLQNAF